jgi:serine/threonine protein kinase/tetratricopeptide (TPR) repeat protein
MSLSDLTWSRLGEIFHAALEKDPADRAAFLAQECAGNQAARREVEAMLEAHEGSTRLLAEDRLLCESEAPDPRLGRKIGAYRLVELIGRGGMGDVYLAERDDDQYERRVAFKLIRPGLAGSGARERFLRERQILAQLEHPNIAMLLDGGMSDDGHPYLVMQYVDGQPITEYCREADLPLGERLELFRTVCETVQVAHQNLVVHRDLKPANILVTADGQVRLLDFGIAKLLDETEPDLTVNLDRMLTPAHAAPEQVTGQTVTTATDVYALGVLLYELVTDDRPFEVDQSSAAAIERSICESAPEPPSFRAPGRRKALRGELDNIVLKALRKEPGRRYQSARELGDDLANHLEGRPVLAQGDSLAYRARKALVRHRWAVGVSLVFLLVITVSLGAITRESHKRLAERDRAIAEQEKADAVVGVLSDLLTRSNPSNQPEGGVLSRDNFIAMLDEAVGGLDDQPAVQVRLRELLADVHRAHNRNEDWLEATEKVLEYHQRVGSSELTMAPSRHNRALAIQAVQGPRAAEPLLRESLEFHRKTLGPLHRDTGIATQDLAQALIIDRPDEAAALMDEAFAIALANDSVDSLAMARAFNGMGNLALGRGDISSARDSYDKALNLLEPFLGEAHPHVMTVSANLALTLRQPEELPRAEALLVRNRQLMEKVQGGRSTSVARSWEALGVVLVLQGRHEEALEAFTHATTIQREVSGPNHANTANPMVKAGAVLTAAGRPREALHLFDQVRAMEAARQPSEETGEKLLPVYGHTMQCLALYEAGRRAEALALLDELSVQLAEPAPAGQAWVLAELATVRTTILLAEGRAAEAVPWARQALAEREKEQGDLPRLLARDRALLAAALAGNGQEEEARNLLVDSLGPARQCGYLTPLQRVLLQEARASLGL